MDRLISSQAAIDALIKADYEFTGILSEPRVRMFEQTINALPPAQPDLSDYSDKLWRAAFERGKAEGKEERKTGRWIPQNHNKVNGMTSTAVYYYPKCSVCGHCANYTNFCPACGADMRGGQNG